MTAIFALDRGLYSAFLATHSRHRLREPAGIRYRRHLPAKQGCPPLVPRWSGPWNARVYGEERNPKNAWSIFALSAERAGRYQHNGLPSPTLLLVGEHPKQDRPV